MDRGAWWATVPRAASETNVFQMSIIINLVHRFNIIPGKIPEDLSVEMDKLILKLIWNSNKFK